MDHRPRKLRDCLMEDSSSCSSSGFRSFPRVKPEPGTKPKAKKAEGFLRSRSKALCRAVINAVKTLQLSAAKSSQSILPRSLSRRLSHPKREKKENEVKRITVRIKDIVRWRSSKDLTEDNSSPLDLESSPPHHFTTTTTTTGPSTGSSSTPCSSWCDSDFTSEFLPSWGSSNSEEYNENDEHGNKYSSFVGKNGIDDGTAVSEAGRKEDLQCDGEKDNYSPVSVLNLEYEEEDDASVSSFDQSLANIKRTKERLMQKIRRFESLTKINPIDLDKWLAAEDGSRLDDEDEGEEEVLLEEEETDEVENRTKQLRNQVKETSITWRYEEEVVSDLFRDELSLRRTRSNHETYGDHEFESQLVARAEAWISGGKGFGIEWTSVVEKREACVREMERVDGKWKSFEQEQEEVATKVEDGLWCLLVDEVLDDL